jgi:hypothetical protein
MLKMSLEASRTFLLVLSVLGIMLLALLWALGPHRFPHDRELYLAGLVFFTLTFMVSFYVRSMRAWSRRLAGRVVARRAARIIRPIERRLPAIFEYELQADQVAVHCDAVAGVKPLSLAEGLVVTAHDLLVVFHSRGSLTPIGKLHVPGAEDRHALLAAFGRHGAECVEVTGPADGYASPLPPARIL